MVREGFKKEVTVWLSPKDQNYQGARLMGHFLELRTGLLLKSVAFMFTAQAGGLDVDKKRMLRPDLKKIIDSRKVSDRSQDVQDVQPGLGMKVVLAGNLESERIWEMRGRGAKWNEKERAT